MWWLVAIAALALAIRAWRRVRELEARDAERGDVLRALASRVAALETTTSPRVAENMAPVAAAAPAATDTVVPGATPSPAAPSPVVPPPPHVPPPPRMPAASPTSPSPTPERVAPPRPSPPPPPPRRPIDWEGLVGVKLFSWIAGVALVFAAVFFLRYSIEHGWLSPPIRTAIGLAVGVGLLVGCEMRAARRYPTTANALDAAGIATLFATLFAAHALWNLLPQLVTFAAMVLVTAVAVALSIRRESVFISLLGLLGGFATPALLSTGENRPIGLFGYLLVLNVGLAWVAYQRRWVVLTVGSVVLTALYQWAWVFRFLDQSPLPLAMGIFLLFPVVQVGALLVAGRARATASPLFARTGVAAAVVPLLFAVYLAAVPSYGAQMHLFFGFVLAIGAGLAFVAAVIGPTEVHLAGAFGTVLAFALWCGVAYGAGNWPGVLAWIAAGVGLYLALPSVVARFGRSLGRAGAHGRLAAAALLAVPAFLAGAEPQAASPTLLFTTLFVLAAIVAVVSVETGDASPHFVGAVFAVIAQGVWSAKHLAPERLYAALGLYAVFGLFYAAVPLIAERLGRRLAPGPGTAITLIASMGLVLFLAAGPVAHVALAAIAILLGLLVAALLLPAITGPFVWLRMGGILVAWVVLATWWATAMASVLLLPALIVIGSMALLVVAGHAARGVGDGRGEETRALGLGLALAVHVFLARVAADPELAFPPWPWLAVLAVVDLAVAIGALAIRNARPHLAAVAVSQLIILLWTSRAPEAPWPLVGILAANGVAVLGFVWLEPARRRDVPPLDVGLAAVAGIMLVQVVAMVAAQADGAPGVGWLLADHVVLLAALLAVAARTGWSVVRVIALVPTTLATAGWVFGHVPPEPWWAGLAFALAPFVVFAADAYRLAPRAPRDLSALQATVASGAVALWLARYCLRTGGLADVVGVVPVGQALLMLGLLRRVLAHRDGELATDGRVALGAAAALGFATAAVPLQLSLEHLTVAWALEAAALAWLYRRIGFPQLVLWVAGIAAAVVVRLTVNPAVLTYHARAETPIFNWYLYLYGTSAAALLVAAAFLRPTDDRIAGIRLSQALPAAATVLLFLLANIEIADFHSTGPTLTFNFFSASLGQDLTYTLGWALFAIGLLTAGIRGKSRPARGAALALLVVTIVKCFLHDLWRLGGLYRVGSFVGLAICLTLVAVLLQRFVFVRKEEAAA
jgi:uncharacterized membrane protein